MSLEFLNFLSFELISVSCLNSKNMPKDKINYGLRKTTTFELDFVTWGEGYILTDGVKSQAFRGKLFIRKPGMYVDGYLPYHCYYLRINLFNSSVDIPHDFPTELTFKNAAKIEDLFSKIYLEFILNKPERTFIINAYLMQIFMNIYENIVEKKQEYEHTSYQYQSMREIASYIQDNIGLNFTLDQLASMSGCSRFTFCRKFNAAMGSTPIEFINSCKIQLSRQLLLETNLSIKEICANCGFENQSYFFILFKKLTGCSPKKYRKDNTIYY